MALPAATTWEVRTGGSDSNGGAFVTGASGVDYSQQDAAQTSYTDLVLATATTLTSAAHPFSANDVGNILNITGGTGFTTGRYQIVSVAVTTATVDRNAGTGGSTGGTGNLGGALLTLGTAAANYVDGNDIWVKSGTYTITSSVTFNTSGPNFYDPCRLLGYGSARGDGGRPTISTSSAIIMITVNSVYFVIDGFILSGLSGTTTRGIQLDGGRNWVKNCKIDGAGAAGAANGGIRIGTARCLVENCEIANAEGAGAINIAASQCVVRACYIHDWTGAGISSGDLSLSVIDTVIDTCSLDGIICYYDPLIFSNCTIYGCRDGIRLDAGGTGGMAVRNCILAGNSGYGLNIVTSGSAGTYTIACAFYNNTSGDRNNTTAGPGDMSLSADPFVNAASGNFALNTTSGGGAAARAAGLPGAFPGGLTTSYPDIGAAQHQESPVSSTAPMLSGLVVA